MQSHHQAEMDIKYLFVLMAGIVISVAAIVVFVLSRRKKEKYNGGLRSYGMAFIKDNEYLKKRKNRFMRWLRQVQKLNAELFLQIKKLWQKV